jgi:hypothetical protein
MLKLFTFLDRFKTKRLTKEEIINDTLAFYSADITRRSVNVGTSIGCAYNHDSGNHCAFGRYMKPKFQEQGPKLEGNTSTVATLLAEQKLKKVDSLLLSQYHGHDIIFWCKLQYLHDRSHYWKEGGLTQEGEDYLKEIKEKYKSNLN